MKNQLGKGGKQASGNKGYNSSNVQNYEVKEYEKEK